MKTQKTKMLEEILEAIEIPPSAYGLAEQRYESLLKWFKRPGSELESFDVLVYPQGSFRLGLVIRPLIPGADFDLDLVCRIAAAKAHCTQKEIKDMVGREIKAYSTAQSFKKEPEEKRRCWTQQYQEVGQLGFHMDVLPAVPETEVVIEAVRQTGAERHLAEHMLAITDQESITYSVNHPNWPNSNPKGYALWLETCMNKGGLVAEAKLRYRMGLSDQVRAEVESEDIPPYRVNTLLQQVIKLLKQHRDQMFREDADSKPISIIITTLAGHAYEGETNLKAALDGALNRMGNYVRAEKPRIPNPVTPQEDFTDRWNNHLEQCFWNWLAAAQTHFRQLGALNTVTSLREHVTRNFGVDIPEKKITPYLPVAPAIVTEAKPPVNLTSGASSWGSQKR